MTKPADFAGAARIPLVGRRALLREADRCLDQQGAHLFYIEGESGIGKTAVVEAVLEQSRRAVHGGHVPRGHVAQQIVSLDRLAPASVVGLIEKIVDALGSQLFVRTRRGLEALAAGGGEPETVRRAFAQEFDGLAAEGVVMAFDAVEALACEPAPSRDAAAQAANGSGAGAWLFEAFLPALRGNVMLLLAGRPSDARHKLEAVEDASPLVRMQRVRLEPFSQEETEEYLQRVARLVAEWGDADAAARLLGFGEERGEVVHLLTGGRPILLALVADLVAHGWVLPPVFGRTVAELGEQGVQVWRPQMERSLVVRIQESATPIGEAIRAMAWWRDGVTSRLLAEMMDLGTPDGEWDTATTTGYLQQAARLALVKAWPDEERVFLYDELYELLERHVVQASSPEERARFHGAPARAPLGECAE